MPLERCVVCFLFPQPNLTHLSLTDNRFSRLPVQDLIRHRKLKMLDVRKNRIQQYDPEFTDMIKNQGLQIRYNGESGSRTAV